jgi:modulator of FtsH protease HflK
MGNKSFKSLILGFIGFEVNEFGNVDTDLDNFKILPFNWLIIFTLFCFCFNTWYTVDKEENATIRTFGKYSNTVGPGLHFKMPWPFQKASTTGITKVKTMEIGFITTEAGPPAIREDVLFEAEMLTGDGNIAVVHFIVQYKSANALKWQYKVKDPEILLNYLAQSSMRLVVGYSDFDQVATSGKAVIQTEVKELLQKLCDKIDFGVSVVAVQLQNVHPPSDVMPAFKDVQTSKEEKETIIHNAEQYKNKLIPEAKGTAKEMINQAKGYFAKRTEAAHGDAAKFLAVLKEYKKNKSITEQRLILETLQEIIPGSEVLVESGNSNSILKFLDMNKQFKNEQ